MVLDRILGSWLVPKPPIGIVNLISSAYWHIQPSLRTGSALQMLSSDAFGTSLSARQKTEDHSDRSRSAGSGKGNRYHRL
jgi:hypothetical protein